MKKGVVLLLCLLMVSFSAAFVVGETVFPINAWADSEYSSNYAAAKTYDGSTSTGWFSKSNPSYPVSLTLDFGSIKEFSSIEIYAYSYYIPITFNLYASQSNASEGDLILTNATIAIINEYNKFDFDTTSARYLRIEETSNARMTYAGAIYEVRANAESNETQCSSDDECESVEGESYCEDGLVHTPIEFFSCHEGACISSAGAVGVKECDEGYMCQEGACVEASCSTDRDCPAGTSIKAYCDGDSLCSDTTYYNCIYGSCVEDYTYEDCDYCYFGCEEPDYTSNTTYISNAKCTQPAELNQKVCRDLFVQQVSPRSFTHEGAAWRLDYNYSYEEDYYINGNRYDAKSAYTSYSYIPSSEEEFEGYLSHRYSITEFRNNMSYKDIIGVFERYIGDGVCEMRMSYSEGVERSYYLCSGAIYDFNEERNYKTINIHWVSGNYLFSSGVYYTTWDYSESEISIEDFLSDITDNSKFRERLEYDLYDFPWQVRNLVQKDLDLCPPAEYNEEDELCLPSWECIVQPVVCPPHGEQQKKCVDLNGCYDDKEIGQSCNPGICSGCYVPKWFGFNDLDYQRCIPYGFRFESQESGSGFIIEEGVENHSNEGYSLEITNDYSAIFNFWDSENHQIVHVYEGSTFRLPSWFGDDLEYLVEKIDESARTITISRKEEYNAYCDIDGRVKRQKNVQPNGEWATCQNHYECSSNFCSSGECIEIASMIQEISGFKEMGVKILCRFADMFGVQVYEQCIYENLGGSSPAMTTSVSAGGSSSP